MDFCYPRMCGRQARDRLSCACGSNEDCVYGTPQMEAGVLQSEICLNTETEGELLKGWPKGWQQGRHSHSLYPAKLSGICDFRTWSSQIAQRNLQCWYPASGQKQLNILLQRKTKAMLVFKLLLSIFFFNSNINYIIKDNMHTKMRGSLNQSRHEQHTSEADLRVIRRVELPGANWLKACRWRWNLGSNLSSES